MSRDPYDPQQHLIEEVARVADALERIAAVMAPRRPAPTPPLPWESPEPVAEVRT